jgi:triosephosphate isomerase
VIAGNWKMHHGPAEAAAFFQRFLSDVPPLANGSIVIFPPALSLQAAVDATRDRPDIAVGVQNVHWEQSGAFTGEISASLAAAAGARLALVGHSERRHLFGETDDDTARKMVACLGSSLVPVLCVGELLSERDAGTAFEVVRRQLSTGLSALQTPDFAQVLIAYEPVWAIGTGRTASPGDAAEMHAEIRKVLRESAGESSETIPILYGGSVKPDNAEELLSAPEVSGVLVGGASLRPDTFAAICRAAA